MRLFSGFGSTDQAGFQLAIGADPSLVYAALWLHLVKERLHEDDTEDLRNSGQGGPLGLA